MQEKNKSSKNSLFRAKEFTARFLSAKPNYTVTFVTEDDAGFPCKNLACMQAHGRQGILGLQERPCILQNAAFYYTAKIRPTHSSLVKKEPMTGTQKLNEHASKCCAVFSITSNENNSSISSKPLNSKLIRLER